MIVLSGADVVLPDGIRSPATVVLEGDRIVEVTSGTRPGGAGLQHFDLNAHVIVPGFIDVHSHPADAGRRHLREVDCDLRSLADIQKAIRERAAKTEPGKDAGRPNTR